MKDTVLGLLGVLSTLFAWGLSSLMLATWIQAAIHPTHQITIAVNVYNELWWEAVLLPVAWLLITWNMVRIVKRARQTEGGKKGP